MGSVSQFLAGVLLSLRHVHGPGLSIGIYCDRPHLWSVGICRKETIMFNTRVRASILSALAALGVASASIAQVVPPDFKASPDVYKVRAENDQYRLVEGTWKPGQQDRFHSHPWMLWYWVTDCSATAHFPDGTTRSITVAAGESGVQEPIASHSLENVGKSQCKIVMFESK